jgi:hypothetical protein
MTEARTKGIDDVTRELARLGMLMSRIISATRANVIEDMRISCLVTFTVRLRGNFHAVHCVLHPGQRMEIQIFGESEEACANLARVIAP